MDPVVRRDSTDIIGNLGHQNERFAGKSVLLTGAAGFLGMQFVHYFAELNDSQVLSRPVRVFAIDNFIRGEPCWMAAFVQRDDIRIMKADITESFHFKGRIDFIIHAASIASPRYYRLHPIQTMDANVLGLRRLLDFAVKYPVEGILFFSSSEVYGDPPPEKIPTPETYTGNVSCIGPRACYDESKRFGETMCVNFHQVYGVPVKIVRPFNNYGPGMKITDRRVIPDFFRNVLVDKNIVIYSDGTPTRTFCYSSDAMIGYLLVLLSGVEGEVFNIGVDRPEIAVKDLADLVVQVSGRSVGVVYQPPDDTSYLQDCPKRRCPDISKARFMLGFEPRVSLEEGLLSLYQWYLENPSGPEG